jgi:uncharacterized protein (DUF427 family)
VLDGETVADTVRGHRVLETSSPPTYYFPPDDVTPGVLERTDHRSVCEWKGRATYFTVRGSRTTVPNAAWCYESPTAPFAAIAGHVAFYASGMDACYVGDEVVRPQPGDFYGGWITSNIVGPFKGAAGTTGW